MLVIDLVLAEGGSFLLVIGLYIPLKIGIPILVLSLPVILLMPETLPKPKLGLHGEPRQRRDDEQSLLEDIDTSAMCPKRRGPLWRLRRRFETSFPQLRTLPLELLLTFLIFFINVLDQGTFAHIVQYTSKRLNWTIAESGKLVPLVSVFKLAILAFVLPATMRFLRLRGWTTDRINAFIIVASLIATATGNLVFAYCSSWQQFTIGNVFHPSLVICVSHINGHYRAPHFGLRLWHCTGPSIQGYRAGPEHVHSTFVLYHHCCSGDRAVGRGADIFVRLPSGLGNWDAGPAVCDRSSGSRVCSVDYISGYLVRSSALAAR